MKKIFIILIITIITALGGCTPNEVPDENVYGSRTMYFLEAFGFIGARVSVIDKEDRLKEIEESIKQDIKVILQELDDVFSVNKNGTVIAEVNAKAGIEPVQVSEEVIFVLKEAIRFSELSQVDEVALYDITIFPIWEAWNFIDYGQDIGPIPTQSEINELLELVDYKKVVIDEDNSTVFLTEEKMEIDLGSIVKGYACDKIKEYLLSMNITSAVIDVGGNILTMGNNYDFENKVEKPWTLQIRTPYIDDYNPNAYKYRTIGSFLDTDTTVVTSGIYQRYIISEVDGKEYHHILHPGTGFPIMSGLLSVTIITDISMTADALSTTVFSLGLEQGIELVESIENTEAVFITEDKEIYVTSGMTDFTFNNKIEEIGYSYKGVYNGTNN